MLVVRTSAAQDSSLFDNIKEHCEVVFAASVEEALKLLTSQTFDTVLLNAADFARLDEAHVSQQAVAILNTLGEGVCLVGPDGTVSWANQRMEAFGQAVRLEVAERSRQAFEYLRKRLTAPASSPDQLHPRKYSFTIQQDNSYFEMIVTGMLNEQRQLTQVATVVWDETAGRRLQKRIDAIDNAGRELVRLDAESFGPLTVEQRITLVQDKIIRYARELLHFDHFVVRILNRQSNELEVLFGVGLEGDEDTQVFANVENNGITGYVAATGRSYICNEPTSDRLYKTGMDGARSSLTVPLRLHDNVIGTLNVESNKTAAFGEDDRQAAEIFGRYIAIAMNILDLMVVERYQTTGQTAESLSEQISEPLSELMTDASMLMEDYIGHDDVRCRLQGMIDCITKVKEALQEVRTAPKGLLGSRRVKPSYSRELAGKQLLVVDDEEFIRQTIAGVARKHGLLVDTASDGRQAKALLAQRSYDVVLSDIKLPHANGYEIFAAARQRDENTPVILMTAFGYDPSHSIVRANKQGLSAVLYKPFKVEQLITEIRRAVSTDA